MTHAFLLAFTAVTAQAPDLVLEDTVPEDAPPYFPVPFAVPDTDPPVVEIEVRHDDLSEANILDWGLLDETGAFRGWGGGNSEPAVVGEAGASRSYLPGPISPGMWSLLIGKAQILEPPGAYRVEIFFRTEATLTADDDARPYDPSRAQSDEGRWYAGDFHVHSSDSGDAAASLDEIATFARSQGLDFVVVTDHNTSRHFDRLDAAMDRHDGFLLIPGIEVTTYQGHIGAFGTSGWLDFRLQEGRTARDLLDDALAQGALLSINHPVLDLGDACIGCAWAHEDDLPGLAGVEVQTGGARLFIQGTLSFWDDRFARGERPAAIGGSDDHRAGTGTGFGQSDIGTPTTMVWAEELSADAILAGVRAHRTVVKLTGRDGPMVTLTPSAAPDEEGVVRGDAPTVTARVEGADGADLYWVVDGALDRALTVDGDPFEATWTAGGALPDRLRVELWQGDDPLTVTSHLFFAAAPDAGPDDGDVTRCGCDGTGREGASAPAFAAAMLALCAALTGRGARGRRRGCDR